MVSEIRVDHHSESTAMSKVAELLNVDTPETVRKWCRQAEVVASQRPGVTARYLHYQYPTPVGSSNWKSPDTPERVGIATVPASRVWNGFQHRPAYPGMPELARASECEALTGPAVPRGQAASEGCGGVQ